MTTEAKKEKSCGGVVLYGGKVLVVRQCNEVNEVVCFPKGHVEEGETEIETAEREIFEETGIRTKLNQDKRVELFYHIDDDNIDKTVVLFAGEPIGKTELVARAGEIEEAKWVEYDEVEDALVREAWKNAWKEMKEIL